MSLPEHINSTELFSNYKVIFESISDAVYIIDFSKEGKLGRFLLTNGVSSQMLGFSKEEFLAMTLLDIMHPDYVQVSKPAYEKLTGDGYYKGNEVHVSKEGKNIPVEINIRKTKLDNREVLIYFARDITKAQKTEKAVFDSEQKYRSLVEQSPFAITILQESKVVFINKIGLKLIKAKSEEDILNKSIIEFIHPDYRKETLERLKKLMNGKKGLYPITNRYICLDGTALDVEVYAMPIQYEGKPAIQLTGRDITTELIFRENLAESEERYRLLVENSPDAILIHQAGKIVFANKSAVKLAGGKSKKDLTGRNIMDFIHPDSHKSTFERLKKIAEGIKVKYPVQEKYLTLSGKSRHIELTVSKVIYNSEPAFQAIIRDISERVKKDNKLKQYSQELEKQVNRRVKEINKQKERLAESQQALSYLLEDVNQSRQELLKANAKLLALNKELESFSYSVSHDLRAPLRRIEGYSQILIENLENHLDDQAKHYFDRISVACKDMVQLIEDLLILSRINKRKMDRKEVNLSRLCRKVIEKLEIKYSHSVNIEEGMAVFADPHLLEIMLVNLFNNAFKFSSGKDKARIKAGTKKINNQQAFFIKDNGVGFNMKYYDRLFQPFQRLHSNKEFTGTGIGLATVLRIVNRHNGEIWAEAEEGKGAVFYFRI